MVGIFAHPNDECVIAGDTLAVCAVWLSMAVFARAAPLRRLLHEYRKGRPPVRPDGSV